MKLEITPKDISPIEKYAESVAIGNPVDLDYAAEKLSQASSLLDLVVAYKKTKTDPLNAALKVIRAETKPLEERLEALIASLRSKITEYAMKVESARILKETAIAARVKEGKGNLSLKSAAKRIEALPEAPSNVQTDSGSVKFATVKKWRIVNITTVPMEYLLPNEPAIRKAMLAGLPIKGIEYYEEKQLRNSR